MPRVSVILTSYNHAKFICESIESVLAQTFSDFELLILDDGSADNSWELINQYDDPRIRAFRSGGAGEVIQRINETVSEIAQGEYVAIHHSDDVWEHDKLAKQVACLDSNPDVGVVFTRVLAINESSAPLADSAHYYFSIFDQPNRSRHEWLRFFYDHGNALCHPSALIRTECFRTCGLYRLCLKQVDDFDMWMRILMRHDIRVLSERLTRFRVRDNDTNVSGNNRSNRVRGIYEQHRILENYREIADFEDLRAIFPEAAKYYRGPDTDLLFSLGRSALDAATRPFAQLFAMNIIFEVMSDPLRCARIGDIYGFSMNDFLDLTGRYDVFSGEEVARLSHGLSECRERISSLDHVLFERESQIANLKLGASERDDLILSIHHALSQREGQIASLEQAASEHDEAILSMRQTLVERDEQVANLNQGVGERDTLILVIHRTLSAREDQIANLEQELFERDKLIRRTKCDLSERERRITNLDDQVSDRIAVILGLQQDLSNRYHQIASLQQTVTEHFGTIQALTSSISWKLTKPLRFVRRLMRGNFVEAFAPLRRSSSSRSLHIPQSAQLDEVSGIELAAADASQDCTSILQPPTVSSTASLEVLPPRMVHDEIAACGDMPEGQKGPDQELRTATKEQTPDPDFDAAFYLDTYPDIRESGIDPYKHFISNGRAEGRIGHRPTLLLHAGAVSIDASKKTVLVVSHEASRTGAPVLSLNIAGELQKRFNVVALVLGDGPLIPVFREAVCVVAGPTSIKASIKEADRVIAELCARHAFEFAIVNSIESRVVLRGLTISGVPTVSLIHEFAAYTRPRDAFRFAMHWSTEVVFSARITHENAVSEYPELGGHRSHILPQGRCTMLAAEIDPETRAAEREGVLRHLRPRGEDDRDTVVIIGAGFVHYRKGVDLFLESAARVIGSPGGEQCRFVWIGSGYDPAQDMGYSVYLAEQVRRAGLERQFTFMAETAQIEDVYASSDILMLSSRLDPLPNVAIDAMSHGLPVVCFAQATGIVDALAESGLSATCVAPYLDTAAMASLILDLVRSEALRKQIGARLRQTVRDQFDMERYVARLEELAMDAKRRLASESESAERILESNLLRQDFFLRTPEEYAPANEVIRYGYVRSWASGVGKRKLFPGFHPEIYLEHMGREVAGMDPLASYLRAGKPDGPWQFEVISSHDAVDEVPSKIRIGLHLHVYYPDLLGKILARLNANVVRPDLFISVCDADAAATAKLSVSSYTGSLVDVRVVPNAGRDLGPFLTAFGGAFAEHYDIVGHLHTKKSAALADMATGRTWFDFLLENLLGGTVPMADIILGRMTTDPTIGIVFPDDPHVVGWGANKPYAETLATAIGLPMLPENPVFPVGSMFWARTEALRPLFNLRLGWQDYPIEPLPYDGSMLHAMERILPLVVAKQSGRVALTNVVGVTR